VRCTVSNQAPYSNPKTQPIESTLHASLAFILSKTGSPSQLGEFFIWHSIIPPTLFPSFLIFSTYSIIF